MVITFFFSVLWALGGAGTMLYLTETHEKDATDPDRFVSQIVMAWFVWLTSMLWPLYWGGRLLLGAVEPLALPPGDPPP